MAHYEDIVDFNGNAKCILCEKHLDDDNCINSHVNGDDHMELYIKRIMVRNSILIQERKPYCLLCITDVHDLESHLQSIEHQRNMEEIKLLVNRDSSFLELPTKVTDKGTLVYCTICDCDIEFTLSGIKQHVQSTKHRRARSMAVQPYNGIFSINGTDTDLWCKICQLCFENYVEIIFEHVDADENHLTSLRKIHRLIAGQNITIEKYLTDPVEDKATCRKCNIEVPCNVDNLERHVKGKRHRNTKEI